MATAVVRIVKTDLPPQHRKPIRDAIVVLYQRIFKNGEAPTGKQKRGTGPSRNALRAELAQSLKRSLDESFGPHWHVLVGEKSGFACKKRNQSMAMWSVEENQIVIWQSPGIEELDATDGCAESRAETDAGEAGEGAADEGEEASEKVKSEAANAGAQVDARLADVSASVKVLEPSDLEQASEQARVVAALRQELSTPEGDPQVLATRIRKQLTAEFGTIWHVIAGSDFAVDAAVDRRNHVLVSTGKTRVLCFQHEQFMGGGSIEWGKIMRAAPYLLLTLFCLGYMTMQAMCGEKDPAGTPSAFQGFVRERLCREDWETNMQYVGAAALVCLFLSRVGKRMQSKPQKVKTA